MSTVEPDGLVRNTEVIQPRLLCDDQIRTGELVRTLCADENTALIVNLWLHGSCFANAI